MNEGIKLHVADENHMRCVPLKAPTDRTTSPIITPSTKYTVSKRKSSSCSCAIIIQLAAFYYLPLAKSRAVNRILMWIMVDVNQY